MRKGLTKPAHELRDEFLKLHDRDSIAQLLEVTTKQLNFYLYVLPDDEKYKTFNIAKKSGNPRQIFAPASPIKVIQSNLKQVLETVYKPKPSTHGFTMGRSIVSNARPHKKRRFVLNTDLENFFPTIHFGRVRGMFMGIPYRLNDEVATILAQICCHNGILPQGAPTSPIISNMICVRLDAKLQQLAKEHQCTYSRYADDITFSTNRSSFPSALAYLSDIGQIEIGNELSIIIEENGFQINPKKTRLQSKHQRQEVTGLTVNRYPNVQRRYIKQIRGILHAWKKYGLDATSQRYYEEYIGGKYLDPQVYRPPLEKVIMGKIEFVGMVKGKNSPIYRDLLKKFSTLAPGYVKNVAINNVPTSGAIIYVDEKKEGKHLTAALRSLQSQKMFHKITFSCFDHEGFDTLEKKLDFAVANPQSNVIPQIFIFGGNISKRLYQKVGGGEQYKFWGSGIYSMVLPLPKHREHLSEISLMLYYKDNDIVRKDKNGKRIYLGSEFNALTGRHLSENLNCVVLNKLGNPLKVVDDKVFNEHNENVALSENEFAENVLEQIDGFTDVDFSGFVSLFGIVSTIVSDFNGELGSKMIPSVRHLRVFLCHASTDKPAVYDLYTRLVEDGVDAWLDKENLLPGQDWELEIRKAVREADVVVVCLSKQFNQAGFRQREVRLALDTAMEKPEGEIFIIPARLEECDNLENLKRLHWVDLFEADGYQRLKQSLGLRAEQVGATFEEKLMAKPLTSLVEKRGVTADFGTLNTLGIQYVEWGNYSKAIECFEQSLLLSREIGDKVSEASILNNLGSTYGKVGDLVRAVELYEQALSINREIGV